MRAHVARMVFFDRGSHIMHFLVHAERKNVDFALVFFTGRMGGPGCGCYLPARWGSRGKY